VNNARTRVIVNATASESLAVAGKLDTKRVKVSVAGSGDAVVWARAAPS
jgi:hypothetical protein